MNDTPLRAEFARSLGLKKRVSLLSGTGGRGFLNSRVSHWSSITSGYNSFILGVANRTTSLFGIERRNPFVDKRLLEFCLALPTEQKAHEGWGRWIARRATANILPAAVQWRAGKADHSANFHRGLLGPDRKILEDTILKSSGRMAEYVDTAVLRKVCRRYLSQQGESKPSDAFVLWRVAKLVLWLRRSGFDVVRGGYMQA
jgi:asparagine synthase (glutamine-hydrolysing)